MPDDFEKPNKLDAIERQLYSPRHEMESRSRKPLREKQYSVANNWSQENTTPLEETSLSVDKSKSNWFLRFFIVAFIFFLAALGYVGFKFLFQDGIDAKNVDILVNAPLTVGAGEVFAFDVLLQNKNQMNMQTVDITVEFPDGTRSVSNISEDYNDIREQIGDIEMGQISKKNYNALLFGEEGDKKEITISLSYRVEGSNALFTKDKKFDVVLKSTPVRLTVTNVKELTSGQPLKFNVELVSNSTQVLQNVMVQATYPFGFAYQKSSLQPKEDNRTWIIPKLEPKEIVNFTVEGTIEGQNKEERYFGFTTGLEDKTTGNPEVVFSKTGTTITLARPFLEVDFAIRGKNSDIIPIDADTMYDAVVSYKNNTDIALRNVVLTLKLDGVVLNKDSIQVPEGFYQSTNNTIVWDSSTINKLKTLPIGTSGDVSFNFSGLGISKGSLLINPEMTITAQVEGNRNPDNQVSGLIENSISKKIRFNSQLSLSAGSEFYSSTFLNTGPIPPVAEQKTFYTAVLEISNPSNKVEEGVVTMVLPNYVTYEKQFLPSTENFSYDEKTRILTWNVGVINTKIGYESSPKRKLSFQVSIVPSVSQLGQAPNLAYDVKFSGVDTFTKQVINRTEENITTVTRDSRTLYDSQVTR
jgi:hypothetical protein